MKKLRKAYKDPQFLMSDDARDLRILSEYLEPRARLKRHKVERAIVFFGSARSRAYRQRVKTAKHAYPDYYRQAAALSEKLARWTMREHPSGARYHFVTGGGPGIMQAVHEGVAKVKRALNVGLNISLPHEQHSNPYVPPKLAFEFHYFFMRKFWFMNLAHALVVFPGGYGTLDELFEVLTLTQTGKSRPMTILLYDSVFWRAAVNFDELTRRGYISPRDTRLFRFADSVDEAFEVLSTALGEG